ncbi:MAG: copper resistance protein CopC [Gemmatimonadaceae bacterium]
MSTAIMRFRLALLASGQLLSAAAMWTVRAEARPLHEPFHLRLVRSEPAKDTTLRTPPTAIKLWFSEPATAAVSSIVVSDASGKPVAVGKAQADSGDANLLSARVSQPMVVGSYTVRWRAASHDGHPVRGEYSFTLAP